MILYSNGYGMQKKRVFEIELFVAILYILSPHFTTQSSVAKFLELLLQLINSFTQV